MKPYPEQLKAVSELLSACRGGAQMPTGSGKSYSMALLINALQVRTLVITPNVELKEQLTRTFSELFEDTSNIVVENIQSNKLKMLTNFDCLILDECHHAASRTYLDLNKRAWRGIYYRYFFSATFFRNNQDEQLLFEGIAGKLAYKLSYADAVKKGQIVPVEGYYLEIPKQPTEAYTWAQVYSELVVNNEPRNLLIGALLARLFNAKASTLCLVKEVAHGQLLADMTGLPFVHGQDEESRDYIRQFNSGGIKAVIATTGMMGEGTDSKPAEYIIVAGLGKAKSQFMQQVGRVLRTYPGKETGKVILIRDKSHKFTAKHFNEQKKILMDEYGVTVSKLEL